MPFNRYLVITGFAVVFGAMVLLAMPLTNGPQVAGAALGTLTLSFILVWRWKTTLMKWAEGTLPKEMKQTA